MNTCRQLIASPVLGEEVAVLPAAARQVSSTAVRNLGTIGGNVCHNEPGADLPPALLALNARAVLRRRSDAREVPLAEFFTGYFETVLEPRRDPLPHRHRASARGSGRGLSEARHQSRGPGVGGRGRGGGAGRKSARAAWPRRASASAARRRFRSGPPGPRRRLKGAVLDAETARAAGEMAATEVDPPSDPHAGAGYRRKMVSVFVRRALLQAAKPNRGERSWRCLSSRSTARKSGWKHPDTALLLDGAARAAGVDRGQARLRDQPLRLLHGPHRRHGRPQLRGAGSALRRQGDRHRRRVWRRHGARPPPAACSSNTAPSSAVIAVRECSWPPTPCWNEIPGRRSTR